jgi:hypothetical protein
MTASQAAAKVRQAIKRTGNDPRGMVSVRNTDYTTEVIVQLRGVYGEQRNEIEEVIDSIDAEGRFSWDVN